MNQRQASWVRNNQNDYPEGFFKWISDNQKIWKAFEAKALQMARVRKRYSARTIVEVLRWNTDLRQTDVLFKISNNMTPGMARLWMQKHGARHPGFFLIQER